MHQWYDGKGCVKDEILFFFFFFFLRFWFHCVLQLFSLHFISFRFVCLKKKLTLFVVVPCSRLSRRSFFSALMVLSFALTFLFTTMYYAMFLVQLSMFVSMSDSLQFLRVTTHVGTYNQSGVGNGVDFTVYRAIDVTAIGLFDADERGFVGTVSARIFDRSTDVVVVGPVHVNDSDARSDDQNPFVFKNVTRVRLSPGVYSIIGVATSLLDRWLTTFLIPGSVVIGDSGDGAVLASHAAQGGNGLLASSAKGGGNVLVVGGVFVFEVVPSASIALPLPEYADCEAVACAGHASGEYNIHGQVMYCDNDDAGGGWLRLWRTNDTSCEANDWTSIRNPAAVGIDPRGCRPTTNATCLGNRINAPFTFNEVRGINWVVWALGVPDAFESKHLCDGVVVRDGSGAQVWVLAAGNPLHPNLTTLCPCDSQFTNTSVNWANRAMAGAHWTCDRVPMQTGGAWTKLFDGGASSFLCAGQSNATADDLLWFQRVLETPQVSLSVAVCLDETGTEDLKLSSGDLYVRATVGFDRTKHCPTIVTTSTPVDSSVVDVGDNDGGGAYWIIPTVIASVLAIIVCILVALLVTKKVQSDPLDQNSSQQRNMQSNQKRSDVQNKAPKSQYSDRLSEIVPRDSRSKYGALSTQERGD